MNTRFLLMARYQAQPVIPIEVVCRDYFQHLTPREFLAKATAGKIKLPIVRMEAANQKAAKGVHINDLADWIDTRYAAAVKELKQMTE